MEGILEQIGVENPFEQASIAARVPIFTRTWVLEAVSYTIHRDLGPKRGDGR